MMTIPLCSKNPSGSVFSVGFLGPDTSSKATFGVLRLVRYLFETRDACPESHLQVQ